jgi:hypothetical protein
VSRVYEVAREALLARLGVLLAARAGVKTFHRCAACGGPHPTRRAALECYLAHRRNV